jgi:hypothetical protein
MTAIEIMACEQAVFWNQCTNRPHCPVLHSAVRREVEWLGSYSQGMRYEFEAPYVTVAVANVAAKTRCYSIRVLYR